MVVAAGPSSSSSKRLSGTGANIVPTVGVTPASQIPMHSRQASSSSCTSSVGNLGSPKPEKRQANSPLPPPPKNFVQASVLLPAQQATTVGNVSSGRNSVASVIEIAPLVTSSTNKEVVTQDDTKSSKKGGGGGGDFDSKYKKSPSKDLEGMYAKVMKKNKLSNAPSQNSSPILQRKQEGGGVSELLLSDPDISQDANLAELIQSSVQSSPIKRSSKVSPATVTVLGAATTVKNADNNYETIDKRRGRSNSFDNKDPGYETIPGDKRGSNTVSDIMNKSFNDFTHMGSAGTGVSMNNGKY